jgi:hypothetical protein
MFFVNLDFIWMFVTIVGTLWVGGAGSVMLFGLYSRFGNTVGAVWSLFTGAGISVVGMLFQNNWAKTIYPFIVNMGWHDAIDALLKAVSSPFYPYISWQMDPVKFPINSMEIMFLAMVSSVVAYIAGSLLTYRQPYNLDRLLHRGKYSIDGVKPPMAIGARWWTPIAIVRRLLGITPEFTFWDKVISWSVFIYSFGWQIGICFFVVLIWNIISPWPAHWWSTYFLTTTLIVGCIVGLVSTVWFMIGGYKDMMRLFKDLKARIDNPLDDGRVEGQVSLMDVEAMKALGIDMEAPAQDGTSSNT